VSDKPQSPEDPTLSEEERAEAAPDQSAGNAGQEESAAQESEGSESVPASEELQRELAEARDAVLRTQAEMQNLRRRTERDVENAHKFALERFVGELLPVVDNLERGLAAFQSAHEEHTALSEGVELTLKNLLDVLRKFQVEPVDPKGQPFNPELHEAMSAVPNPEVEPNTVIDVFQKGYQLNGRLIRPAMVVVSKAP